MILVLASLLVAPAQSAALPAACTLRTLVPDAFVSSNKVSGDYWTNMMGSRIVMFTDYGGTAGKYQAFDLETREAIRLTDDMDPFPAPDNRRVYIHPNPIRFYSYDDVRKKIAADEDPVPMFEDKVSELTGWYQSMGVLSSSREKGKNESVYRVLTGNGEGSIQDYRVEFDAEDRPVRVKPLRKKALWLCPNLRLKGSSSLLDFDTPILSQTGKEFAVLDRKRQSTIVLSFDEKKGNCAVVDDLGIETGKVHFSADGRKIAFHANIGSTVRGLTRGITAKPFLYDRDARTIQSLWVGDYDQDSSSSGTFPAFLPDGRILYQRIQVNPATGNASRAFVTVDPAKLGSASFETAAAKDPDFLGDEELTGALAFELLVRLWERSCASVVRDDFVATLVPILQMDPKACRDFVSENWDKQRTKVLRALLEDSDFAGRFSGGKVPKFEALVKRFDSARILAACPKQSGPEGKLTLVEGDKIPYPPIIGLVCARCHGESSPVGHIPWDDPEAMRGMMALGHSADEGQRYHGKTFLEQLEDILKENTGKEPPPGVPKVPADRIAPLKTEESEAILRWVKEGKKGVLPPTR